MWFAKCWDFKWNSPFTHCRVSMCKYQTILHPLASAPFLFYTQSRHRARNRGQGMSLPFWASRDHSDTSRRAALRNLSPKEFPGVSRNGPAWREVIRHLFISISIKENLLLCKKERKKKKKGPGRHSYLICSQSHTPGPFMPQKYQED